MKPYYPRDTEFGYCCEYEDGPLRKWRGRNRKAARKRKRREGKAEIEKQLTDPSFEDMLRELENEEGEQRNE